MIDVVCDYWYVFGGIAVLVIIGLGCWPLMKPMGRQWPRSFTDYIGGMIDHFLDDDSQNARQYQLFKSDPKSNRLFQEMNLALNSPTRDMRWYNVPDSKYNYTYCLVRDAFRPGDTVIVTDPDDVRIGKYAFADHSGVVVRIDDLDGIRAHQTTYKNLTGRVWVLMWDTKNSKKLSRDEVFSMVNHVTMSDVICKPVMLDLVPAIVFVAMQNWSEVK